jgi:AraC-like DNA-binding protein
MSVIDESVRQLPAPSLRPFVEWYAGFRQAGVAPARHRGLPSPSLTFILTLDDPLVVAAHSDPRQPPEEYSTLLGGLHTAPALITHEGRQSGIQLALTPLGARVLLGAPAGQFAGLDVDASAVLGRFAGELRERVGEQETWTGRFGVLDTILGERAAAAECAACVRPEIGYAWRRLRAASGAVRVSAIAAETGWSERYLNARFRAETGLSPKEAARVFRFTAARGRIADAVVRSGGGITGAGLSLADLAAECGYYDQAHLARDFRALAGCPPTQWVAEEFRNIQASVADLRE